MKAILSVCSPSIVLALVAVGASVAPQDSMEELMEQTRSGPEHERLAALAGEWEVALVSAGSERRERSGKARVRGLLGGRFVDVDGTLGEDPRSSEFRFTLGFDPRHEEFSLILIDETGTYAVTARGSEVPDSGLIRMRGVDDDPYMQSLGFEKKYAFDLDLGDADTFAIKLHFVDTRTEAEPLREQYSYSFTRR